MIKFYIVTISLLVFLLTILFVMNKVWKRYSLEELLKKNDVDFYNEICRVAEKHDLSVTGITLAHYSLVKDDQEKFSSPERACENYLSFFSSYYKDPKAGVMETGIMNSMDLWKIVEVLNNEGLVVLKHKAQDYEGKFSEDVLLLKV